MLARLTNRPRGSKKGLAFEALGESFEELPVRSPWRQVVWMY
jgi:hypothetical protein